MRELYLNQLLWIQRPMPIPKIGNVEMYYIIATLYVGLTHLQVPTGVGKTTPAVYTA